MELPRLARPKGRCAVCDLGHMRAVETHYEQATIRESIDPAVDPSVTKTKGKDLASFQIANGGELRHVMCVGGEVGFEPRTFG